MELLIKQRVFAWGDTYDVYDSNGQPKYYVKAEIFSLGHQIHVYNKRTGEEVGSIHQKLLTFLPKFEIVIGGRTVGTISREFTFSSSFSALGHSDSTLSYSETALL